VILAVSAFFRELTRLDDTTGTAVICYIAAWLPGPAEQREPSLFSQAHFGNAVCTNAGRRATQVALTMHSGKVQYVSRAHGFLDWQINGEGQPRIFFQAFDVEGNVELCKGDEVTFNIADKVRRSLSYMHGSSMSLNCIGLPHATVWNIAINHVGPVFKQDLRDSAQALLPMAQLISTHGPAHPLLADT